MGQTLLFPDPKPLDQRLGRKFFRRAPHRPGVYLMRDASDKVLYVGKAKDLRQRLNNYRRANPDRMPSRHLRMVREVARIEFQFCANESAALRRESRLLRSLKPKFNRVGVWPGKPRFIVWRTDGEWLELAVVEIPEPGCRRFGPLNGSARTLHQALARLLWLATHSDSSVVELPTGWMQSRFPETVKLNLGRQLGEVLAGLENFFWQSRENFLAWLGYQFCERTHRFERAAIESDMETLQNFLQKREREKSGLDQFALL